MCIICFHSMRRGRIVVRRKEILKLLNQNRVRGALAALAFTLVIGSTSFFLKEPAFSEEELPVFTEPFLEMTIQEEAPPLASAPKVTKKVKKKTSEKKVRLPKASEKSYTAKLPTKKKTSTKTNRDTNKEKNEITETTIDTTVEVATTETYTKKKDTKVVKTVTTTTVQTTVVTKPLESEEVSEASAKKAYLTTTSRLAPEMNQNVLYAFETLGFQIKVDPNVNYSGYYNTRDRLITLNARQLELFPDTVYHELGHFVAFAAGNVDSKADFAAVYQEEKGKLTGSGAVYAAQSASEYFAESVKDYITSPGILKSNRPKTYQAVENAIEKITESKVAALQKTYAAVWK